MTSIHPAILLVPMIRDKYLQYGKPMQLHRVMIFLPPFPFPGPGPPRHLWSLPYACQSQLLVQPVYPSVVCIMWVTCPKSLKRKRADFWDGIIRSNAKQFQTCKTWDKSEKMEAEKNWNVLGFGSKHKLAAWICIVFMVKHNISSHLLRGVWTVSGMAPLICLLKLAWLTLLMQASTVDGAAVPLRATEKLGAHGEAIARRSKIKLRTERCMRGMLSNWTVLWGKSQMHQSGLNWIGHSEAKTAKTPEVAKHHEIRNFSWCQLQFQEINKTSLKVLY